MASGDLALRVRGLTRSYGARRVLDGVDMDVHAGEVYGFLGANGAGKTTALRCILGLVRPDAGEVRIFGDADPVRARTHLGAMVETPAFHGWRSARDNLRLAAAWSGRADDAEVSRVLDRAGLASRADDAVSGYSLGMRQRLGIARAMLGRPRLLLLDEPTNGLDPRGMREVRDLLADLARTEGVAVLLSSHLLAEIEQACTTVGILDGGKVVTQGRIADLTRTAPAAASAGARPAEAWDVGVSDRAAAVGVIGRLAGVELVGDGEQGRARLHLHGVRVATVVRALVEAGVDVDAVVPVGGARLEDVFLARTHAMEATP